MRRHHVLAALLIAACAPGCAGTSNGTSTASTGTTGLPFFNNGAAAGSGSSGSTSGSSGSSTSQASSGATNSGGATNAGTTQTLSTTTGTTVIHVVSSSTSSTGTVQSTIGQGTTGNSSSGGPGTTGLGTIGNTSSTSSTSSTGATTAGCPTVQELREQASFTSACLTDVVVLFQNSPGAPSDGGTEFAGDYYVGDSSGFVLVYKEKASPPTSDPGPGLTTSISGELEYFPFDGGDLGQAQVSGKALTLTLGGAGTLPTAVQPQLAQLDMTNGDQTLVGQYVQVPTGNYTQNSTSSVWVYTSTKGTSYDGVVLTAGDGTTILVETDTFKYPTKSCTPDAGAIDFSKGGFKGIYDTLQTDDGAFHKVVVFGSCADL